MNQMSMQLAFLSLALLFFTGCFTPTGYDVNYTIAVSGDRLDSLAASSNWWEAPLPARAAEMKAASYEDNLLSTQWRLQNWQIPLKVQNRTDEPITILWPDARIRLEDREDQLYEVSQGETPENTAIEPGKSRSFRVFPRSMLQRIRWGDPAEGRGHWDARGTNKVFVRRMSETASQSEREEVASRAVGQDLFFLLPIEAGGQRHTYVFRLEILEANAYGNRY